MLNIQKLKVKDSSVEIVYAEKDRDEIPFEQQAVATAEV